MTVTVAILGRPNVGKSTLFNRLIGQKLALVDDQPGVTRDRREGLARIADIEFQVFDTAGFDEAKKGSLEARMSDQAAEAARLADHIFFVIDARAGVTPVDQHFAERIRKLGKPVTVLANKAETRALQQQVAEAYSLGLGEPFPISGEHGEGLEAIYDVVKPLVVADLKRQAPAEEEEIEEPFNPDIEAPERPLRPLRLAIIGQPNAGKSTLVNALLGEERMLTGPEAGITRDAIANDWEWGGREIKLWDTAGIRRKGKVKEKLEKLSVSDALRAVKYAEVVVVLVDASVSIEKQDLTLCDLVAREGRALVLALSKWDLVEDKNAAMRKVNEIMEDILPDVRGLPIVTLSAKQGRGEGPLMKAVLAAEKKWNIRISTRKFNLWLEEAVQRNPPPAPGGRRIKIRYGTQANARPPTFALFGNQLEKLPTTYQRYLMNGLRETMGLEGIPIRFALRGSKNPFDDGRK
ncbi:ribosome biogenesis GTPase Der [Aestuariivirga litoralis]|uniref:ribosome biogenesis GTPase Der n=1 Tax=Aestuariivirga litoralis TaxID=2650924 RepID=UPI0018C4D984|nr:ribosome biogenesis GTPase Der [Aestuariivirga litoralis]MBG1232140.1 ribosome biogenesis GTPase Der [Aestuariivirga litoralis]